MNPQEMRAGLLFVAPVAVLFLVLRVIPALLALYFSFTDYSLLQPPRWVGARNYVELLRDPVVVNSFLVTITYTVGTVLPSAAISLAIAVMLNKRIRGRAVYRTAFFLPQIASWVAIAMIWSYILNPSYGVANYFLRLTGFPGVPWLTSSTWALPSLILIGIWRNLGYAVVIYLAGLQGIPQSLYEAAVVDGARPWMRFRRITVPMLKPTTVFIVIITTILSLQTFDQVFVLTGGGPADATRTVVYTLYQNAFLYLRMGYASAIGFILFVLVLVLAYIGLRASGQLRGGQHV